MRFRIDHRADGIARILRRTDLETAHRVDKATEKSIMHFTQ